MKDTKLTTIDNERVLEATLNMPYTLTTGHAAGSFLAELAHHRILGSVCAKCDRVLAPAQDFCTQCGGASTDFVTLPETGTITALTRTAAGAFAFIQVDGANTSFLHRVTEEKGRVAIGSRVKAVWSPSATGSILDVAHFEQVGDPTLGEVQPNAGEIEAVVQLNYGLNLKYEHSFGPHYGRLFDELASSRRLLGSLCPKCRNVLVPPREFCDHCFVRTQSHVDVMDTGRLQAFSIIYLEFVGQTRKPPYIYAEVVLDGSATRLIHTLGGFDVETAQDVLSVGMPVKAVWKDATESEGTLNDIEYFEPIFES